MIKVQLPLDALSECPGVARWFHSGQSFSLLPETSPCAGVPDSLEDGALLFSLAGLSPVEVTGFTSPNRTDGEMISQGFRWAAWGVCLRCWIQWLFISMMVLFCIWVSQGL